MKGLCNQSSPQRGLLPPNEVSRIVQHVREGKDFHGTFFISLKASRVYLCSFLLLLPLRFLHHLYFFKVWSEFADHGYSRNWSQLILLSIIIFCRMHKFFVDPFPSLPSSFLMMSCVTRTNFI